MRQFAISLLVVSTLLAPAYSQKSSPLVGRWNFNITAGSSTRAIWFGITEKAGKLEVWFQPSGGNVYQVKEFKAEGSHLTATASGAIYDLDTAGDKITGTQKRGNTVTPISGLRAPKLDRKAPKSWTKPEAIFNGKNLDGWEPMGNPASSHWGVKDGLLFNEEKGANLKSTRKFQDFKLHFEVNGPDHANSGFYLRGRYEVQIEYEPLTSNPPERRLGSIYGRIAPKGDLPRKPGVWETFDVTLVGRTLTVVRNGVTTIDKQEIEGITGGAIDADEAEPGPFYIQGDHTGGLKFRNITIAVPKK